MTWWVGKDQWLRRRHAALAFAAYLHRRALDPEALGRGPVAQPLLDDLVGEFVHLAAALADGEGDQPLAVAMFIGAGNEGIERFQPMRQPALHQLVEGAIDLQWRPQPVGPQLVEDI